MRRSSTVAAQIVSENFFGEDLSKHNGGQLRWDKMQNNKGDFLE